MGGGRGQHAFKLKKKFMEVGLGSEVYKSNFCVLQVCSLAVENNLLPETTKEIGILDHCIGADWEKRQESKSITLILMFEPQQANYYQVIE